MKNFRLSCEDDWNKNDWRESAANQLTMYTLKMAVKCVCVDALSVKAP